MYNPLIYSRYVSVYDESRILYTFDRLTFRTLARLKWDLSAMEWWSRPYEYLWAEHVLNYFYGSQFNKLSLLEAACGPGHPWLLRASELGFRSVTGVDLIERSLLVDRVSRSNLSYLCHDLSRPLSPKYDVITCLSVLEHMPKQVQELALQNMCSAVIPGGCILITLDLPGFNFTTDLSLIWDTLDAFRFRYLVSESADFTSCDQLTPSNSIVKSTSNIKNHPDLRVYRIFAIKKI